ncbi:hypothetical protein [Aliarcobacter vitoriensis]|uniref:Hydrogenase-4 component G n=1 Tax=Aliarcobacter vitoriensis TaxID=2011099 RepID=A0A366MT48_9BACT|nr:hypothetical protein [Aliarcobacter vitoriensis]RBQ29227.1 hypothetical protein CRU91_05190 [Aliarcobacter vitoriensis]
MQISSSTNQALNAFQQNASSKVENTQNSQVQKQNEQEKSVDEIINNSAAKVAISMNAQYILFEMNASKMTKDNAFGQLTATKAQQGVLDFLGGTGKIDNMSLSDIGYKGKPILELTKEEATNLVGENGFFGIKQTSDRVAGFSIGIAGDNLDNLAKVREGIVKGFEEAEKMFGGELPEISYKTQERTLALIDAKIESLKNPKSEKTEQE